MGTLHGLAGSAALLLVALSLGVVRRSTGWLSLLAAHTAVWATFMLALHSGALGGGRFRLRRAVEALWPVFTQSERRAVFLGGALIGLALFAIHLAARPSSDGRTFGWYRLEILAAVVNAMLLFGVAIWVLVEAWRRFTEPHEIRSGLMLVVAVVGLIANAVSARRK